MQLIHNNKNWLFAIVCGVCLVGVAVGVAQRPPADSAQNAVELSNLFREVSRNALPSIVSITTEGRAVQLSNDSQLPFDDENSPFGELFRNRPEFREFMKRRRMPAPRGKGSGVIIEDSGVIMTNSHVVRNAEKVTVRLHDGREFLANEIKYDRRSDLAVIKIEGADNLSALRLGDSDAMQIGDWVLAVGSPFGFDLTVTAGIISAKGRGPGINVSEDYLQTDAAINPGNSGGPLLNLSGEVIGINTAISTRSGGYDGIGFAIPANMARWVADQLLEKGTVRRAFLGVGIQPLDSQLAKRFNTPAGQGALVTNVMPDSTAADSGLKPGDVILDLNGQKVGGLRGLRVITEKLTIGKGYPMTILRDGKRMEITVVAREMPEKIAQLDEPESRPAEPETPKENFDDLGLQVQELTAELAERLGVQEASGVLISAVEPESPADEAGLRPGQVIQEVDGVKVSSPEELSKAVKKSSKTEGALLLVLSRSGPRFVVVKIK